MQSYQTYQSLNDQIKTLANGTLTKAASATGGITQLLFPDDLSLPFFPHGIADRLVPQSHTHTHIHTWLSQRPEGPRARRPRQMAELVLIVSSCCAAHAGFGRKVIHITHAGRDEKLLLITDQIQLLVNSCKVMALPCG